MTVLTKDPVELECSGFIILAHLRFNNFQYCGRNLSWSATAWSSGEGVSTGVSFLKLCNALSALSRGLETFLSQGVRNAVPKVRGRGEQLRGALDIRSKALRTTVRQADSFSFYTCFATRNWPVDGWTM